jgi:hypothetical protein
MKKLKLLIFGYYICKSRLIDFGDMYVFDQRRDKGMYHAQPLIAVIVHLNGVNPSNVSNYDGNSVYRHIPVGEYEIACAMIGYRAKPHKCVLAAVKRCRYILVWFIII